MTSDTAPPALHHYVFRCSIGQECYAEPAGKLLHTIVHDLWVGRKRSLSGEPGSRPSIQEVAIAGRRTVRVTTLRPLEPRDIEAIDGACRDYQDALVAIGEAQISSCVDLAIGPDKTAVTTVEIGPRVHVTNISMTQELRGTDPDRIIAAFNRPWQVTTPVDKLKVAMDALELERGALDTAVAIVRKFMPADHPHRGAFEEAVASTEASRKAMAAVMS